jgi:chorismate dehydratase
VALAPKLRVGIVDYLNAWPLAWGFLSGQLGEEFEAVYLPPAEVADRLRNGSIDIGLIPSIELQRIADLRVVPGLCVASTHEVRSVVLLSTKPMEEIRSVALDRNSRTSAALTQILLRERNGVDPILMVASPDAEAMLRSADAALIIGDPALRIDRDRYRVWDLAAEWRRLTGRPFVFAIWAVRGAVEDRAERCTETLNRSLALGTAATEALVARAVGELGLEAQAVREYLTRCLSYRLDDEALAGLGEFYGRAASLGLIEAPRAFGFLGAAPSPRGR